MKTVASRVRGDKKAIEEHPVDLPQASAPSLPKERDPNDIAECDGCENLFYESELTEIRPSL